jgi:hypothetical protein
VLVAALLSGGVMLVTPGVAHAVEKTLSVPVYKQEKSKWCWAAAVKSIVKFKTGNTVSQCTVVKRGKNSSSCANSGGSKSNVMNALNKSGVNPGTEISPGWDYVTSEMTLSRPIYSSIKWRSGGGHAHVIRGYYNTGYSYGVSYIDPWTGTTTSREWGTYLSNSSWTAGSQLIHLYKK